MSPVQEKLLEDSYSPVMLAKAVKNAKEQELLRAAHVRLCPSPSASSSGGTVTPPGTTRLPAGSGCGGCHPIPAVAGEDGAAGAGG